MRRLAVIALVLAGVAQVTATLVETGYNTAVGLGVGALLFALAILAALGRRWSLVLATVFSGLLGIAAIGQLVDRIEDGFTVEFFRVLAFQALVLTASVASFLAVIHLRSSKPREV